jgi:hypothetical protein
LPEATTSSARRSATLAAPQLSFCTSADQPASISADVECVRSFARLEGLQVGGFVYDVETGRLTRIC